MGAGTRSPSTAVRRSTRRRRPIPRSRGSRARTRESARRNRSRRPRECCVGVWHPAVICAASRRVPCDLSPANQAPTCSSRCN